MRQNHSHCHFRYAFELLLNEHAHVSRRVQDAATICEEESPITRVHPSSQHVLPHPPWQSQSLLVQCRAKPYCHNLRIHSRPTLTSRSSREAGRHGQNKASLRACTHLPSSTSTSASTSTTKVNTYSSSNGRGPVSQPSSSAPSPTPSAF